jgi:hypothetical protein
MLSGTAIRQLLWLWMESMGIEPSTHIAAVRDRKDRYRAIRELEQAGLLQVERRPGRVSRYEVPFHVSKSNLFIYSGTVTQPGGGVNTPLPSGVDTPLVGETPHGVNTPPVGEIPPTYDSPYDEAVAIDSMSDEGRDKPGLTGTPFRKRRSAQREFVQRMWAELFPSQPPLIDANANEFLRLCDESAELVYEIFEKLQTNPKAKFAYVRGAMRNEKEKREANRTEGTTSPASSQFYGWESDEAYYEHQRKTQEAVDWLRENGISDDD